MSCFFTNKKTESVSRVLSRAIIYLRNVSPRSFHLSAVPPMRGMAAIAIMRQGISRNGVASDRVYICWTVTSQPVSSYLAFPSLPAYYAGGLFLLHFPGSHLRRTLSVILSLWSPDFPHNNTFRHLITRLPNSVWLLVTILFAFWIETCKQYRKNRVQFYHIDLRLSSFPTGLGLHKVCVPILYD